MWNSFSHSLYFVSFHSYGRWSSITVMANVTDPLLRSIHGTDPQNLLEYIIRQKIYDSRYWKEECFGLTVVDVLEKAATSLTCVGGTMGPNQQPTKFLCLTLKLLQLQPETATILTDFIQQEHFKYVRVLGCFYLRLTGRPAEIYQALEPLYGDSSKLRLRETQEWNLTFIDQVVHELLTKPYFVGITLPRLPARATLEQEGYIDEGPRPTSLEAKIQEAGGLEELLRYKALVQMSPPALILWEERNNKSENESYGSKNGARDVDDGSVVHITTTEDSITNNQKRKINGEEAQGSSSRKREKKEKKEKQAKAKQDRGYGSLFTSKASRQDKKQVDSAISTQPKDTEEGSEKYWNEQRAKLGLKPLNNR